MKTDPLRRRWPAGALALLCACADAPPGPGADRPASPALVSGAIAVANADPSTAVLGRQAYVSMAPGTDTTGRRAEITNPRNGAFVTTPMAGGGFDPVPIRAEAEDTLSVTVVHADGSQTTTYGVVPRRSRPTVVRTSPPSGRTDVALNSIITVVFNQPMDSASLPGALRLLRGIAYVRGAVTAEVTDGAVLGVRFVPDSLVPGSTYELSVAPSAKGIDGTQLSTSTVIRFRTPLVCYPPPEGRQMEDSARGAIGGRLTGHPYPSFILLQDGSSYGRILVYGPDLAASPTVSGVIFTGYDWCHPPNVTTYNGRDWPTGEHLYLHAEIRDSSGVQELKSGGTLRYDTAVFPLVPAPLPGMAPGLPLPPAALANVVGSWMLSQPWGPPATFEVASDGSVAIRWYDCTLSGTIRPRQGAIFDLTARQDPTSCVNSWAHDLPYAGIALTYPLESGGWQLLVRLETSNGIDFSSLIGLGRR